MKKTTIALILLPIIAVSVIAYFMLKPSTPDLRVLYILGEPTPYVVVNLSNYGDENIIVKRVELIYVPEDIGIVWNVNFTVEPREWVEWVEDGTHHATDKNMKSVSSVERVNGEPSGLFVLLWENKEKSNVKIIVETTEAIYTFQPSKEREKTSTTDIEPLETEE